MTLIVARIEVGRIAIVSDTMISVRDSRLAMDEWTLKSICLPGGVCVSYAGSPELATRSFQEFRALFPSGASFSGVIEFFEASSLATNNDYIIAFASPARLVSVKGGRRTNGLSKSHWIGDKAAYERFRQVERNRQASDQGRAVHATLFADELHHSPASDLHGFMRATLGDRSLTSVGGFIVAISNRDQGFRFSVYSDVLLDWPKDLDAGGEVSPTDRIDLFASGENDRYSTNQIAGGYLNLNTVAFYLLKGRLVVVYHERADGTVVCLRQSGVEPSGIGESIDTLLGFPFRAMCMVMSAREADTSIAIPRTSPTQGMGMALYCEANTMPRPS